MSSVKSTQAIPLLVMGLALVCAARPAQAQTETVLYNFTGGSDGNDPSSGLTSDGAGNFYGTTVLVGQSGDGTVFELSPNGSGGWNETTIYTFPGGLNGFSPFSNVIFDSAGNLYGTLYGGGAHNFGAVFELSRIGTSWTETVLYSFVGGMDGATPYSGLIMDPAGNLYGTTSHGGSNSVGTVFELSKSGGGWTERVIYSPPAHKFNSSASPPALTMDAAGNIFGASYTTVYTLSPNGHGGWNPTVLHTFSGSYFADTTPVLDQAGNVYGTTFKGGAYNAGTVYMLTLGKTGTWTSKILHAFGSGQDGAYSFGRIVFDAAGNIYGTTLYGGQFGAGTVFELVAQARKGSYKEKVLWSFNSTDGYAPSGSLILDSAGNLYGTTDGGGNGYPFASGYGVAFEVTP